MADELTRAKILKIIADELDNLAPQMYGIDDSTPLSGDGRVVKSHDLVVLMLALEDRFTEHGKTLEWPLHLHRTFATVGSLADFLENQL